MSHNHTDQASTIRSLRRGAKFLAATTVPLAALTLVLAADGFLNGQWRPAAIVTGMVGAALGALFLRMNRIQIAHELDAGPAEDNETEVAA